MHERRSFSRKNFPSKSSRRVFSEKLRKVLGKVKTLHERFWEYFPRNRKFSENSLREFYSEIFLGRCSWKKSSRNGHFPRTFSRKKFLLGKNPIFSEKKIFLGKFFDVHALALTLSGLGVLNRPIRLGGGVNLTPPKISAMGSKITQIMIAYWYMIDKGFFEPSPSPIWQKMKKSSIEIRKSRKKSKIFGF